MLTADMIHVLDALNHINDKIESAVAYLRLGELYVEQRGLIRERYAKDCYSWGEEDAEQIEEGRIAFDSEMAKFDARLVK